MTFGDTAAGLWAIYYKDFVLLSADGTVHKIYSGDKSATIDVYPSAGMTGVSYGVQHAGGQGVYADATTTFYHGDHLGSSRLLSGPDGYPTWQGTYYPYGAEYIAPGVNNNTTVNHYKFTGKERDAESGLDDFGARYFSSAAGRFMSPDPPLLDQNPGNPQSWNLYSYVRNNPMNSTDPTGNTTCSDGSDRGSNGQPKCDGGGSSESVPANTSPAPLAQETPPSQMTTLQFLGQELLGVYDTTAAPLVSTVEHPVQTVKNAASNLVEGVKDVAKDPKGTLSGAAEGAKDLAVQFGSKVASGDPRAIGQATGLVIDAYVAVRGVQGKEIKIGDNLRIAPAGNRTGGLGELPHYHRRIVGPNGKTVPGGGIGWHRPWEP